MAASSLLDVDALLSPTAVGDFISDYWERRPLLIRRGDARYYGGLLDRAQLQRLFHYTCVDRRDARVVKNGMVDEDRSIFCADGLVNPAALMSAYADGFTVVLNNVQRRHDAIARLCRAVETRFRQPVGANAYLTPPRSSGLAPHFDDHDVFVLQLEGEKSWSIYATAIELPLRGQHFPVDRAQLGSPIEVSELHAGDLLYLPRGFVHEAAATRASSLHLTLGISCYRWVDVLVKNAELRAKDQPGWRRAVPSPGVVARATPVADSESRSDIRSLEASLAQIDIDFIHTLAPLEDGGLEYLDALEYLTLDSRFRHRAGTICRVESTEEDSRIHFPGNTVVCPAVTAATLMFIAEHVDFVARDLPSALSDSSKLNIVRKLSAAGLLIPVPIP